MSSSPIAEQVTSDLERRNTETLPLLLTVPDVARRTSAGRSSVYEWINSGGLRVVRLGRSVRVRRKDLEEWIDALATESAA